MKYIVIFDPKIEDLVKAVNEKIIEGFEPIGSIVSDIEVNGDDSEIYSGTQYLQSMIKK